MSPHHAPRSGDPPIRNVLGGSDSIYIVLW